MNSPHEHRVPKKNKKAVDRIMRLYRDMEINFISPMSAERIHKTVGDVEDEEKLKQILRDEYKI